MNATIALRWGGWSPSWYVPLLLPLMPMVAAVLEPARRGWTSGDGSGGLLHDFFYGSTEMTLPISGLVVLFGLGLVLALGVPWWLKGRGAALRKEVELLRMPLIGCLFIGQVPMLLGGQGHDVAIMLAGTSFVLLAAMPFGMEFQQRTLDGLLSQPVARSRTWGRKTAVMGVAILIQYVTFVVSMLMARLMSLDDVVEITVGLGVAALAAWMTTPWWILVTRSLLAGVVFSITVPPLALVILGMLLETVAKQVWGEPRFLNESDGGRWVMGCLIVGGLMYAGAAFTNTRRRWLRMEVVDAAEREGHGVYFPGLRREVLEGVRSHWLAMLVVKELRLQTVTLATAVLTVGLMGLRGLVTQNSHLRELLTGLTAMLSVMVVLVAAATCVAEERRLGTLDAQHLLPRRWWVQWWMKVGMAAGLALVGVIALGSSQFFGATDRTMGSDLQWLFLVGMGWLAFVAVLLASTAMNSAVRAMVLGILVVGLGAAMVTVLVPVISEFGRSAHEAVMETLASDPERWRAMARALTEDDRVVLASRTASEVALFRQGLLMLALLPFVVVSGMALWFSQRNFRFPVDAAGKLPRQVMVLLGTLLTFGAVFTLGTQWVSRRSTEAEWALKAVDLERWERSLSPAERLLLERFPENRLVTDRGVTVTLRIRDGTPPGVEPIPEELAASTRPIPWRFFPPLSAEDRGHLLQHAEIETDLREAIQREAIQRGDSVTNLPAEPIPMVIPWRPTRSIPSPPGMSMEMLRRYGLMPGPGTQLTPREVEAPEGEGDGVPGAAARRPEFQMSPALMRRYGLVPSTAPDAAQDPGSGATNANVPPAGEERRPRPE